MEVRAVSRYIHKLHFLTQSPWQVSTSQYIGKPWGWSSCARHLLVSLSLAVSSIFASCLCMAGSGVPFYGHFWVEIMKKRDWQRSGQFGWFRVNLSKYKNKQNEVQDNPVQNNQVQDNYVLRSRWRLHCSNQVHNLFPWAAWVLSFGHLILVHPILLHFSCTLTLCFIKDVLIYNHCCRNSRLLQSKCCAEMI